ncbi:MAG: UDP-N-acetylglucosamine 2-epimerase (non-hydrolyzing), partial [Bacteroidota bacterium]
MSTLLVGFGTRPEHIKIRPVLQALAGRLPVRTVFTGQHTELVDATTDAILHIPEGANRLDRIVAAILDQAEPLFADVAGVLVQGDTTSALALAMAAFHRQVPVSHLEAGLRTYQLEHPYPEEFNRQTISRIAAVHFCPTELNRQNLLTERCPGEIFVTGNTGLDALRNLVPTENNEVLVTLHRRENHAQIDTWFRAVNRVAGAHPELRFVLPLHPNPNVQRWRHLLTEVAVVDPLPPEAFQQALASCRMVISDSGGLQEECAFLNKRIIVCRTVTERPESLEKHSWLCPAPGELPALFDQLIALPPVQEPCPFGDG